MVAHQTHPALAAILDALDALDARGTQDAAYGVAFRDGYAFACSLLDGAVAEQEAVAAILSRFEARINAERKGTDRNATAE